MPYQNSSARGTVAYSFLVIHGEKGMGHNELAQALISKLERFPVKVFDLQNLYADASQVNEVNYVVLYSTN
jgi:hypothetical protein